MVLPRTAVPTKSPWFAAQLYDIPAHRTSRCAEPIPAEVLEQFLNSIMDLSDPKTLESLLEEALKLEDWHCVQQRGASAGASLDTPEELFSWERPGNAR